MSLTKSNHEHEVQQLQSDLDLVRDSLKMTKDELSESQRRVTDGKSTISGLNDDLDRFRKLQEESAQEVRFIST